MLVVVLLSLSAAFLFAISATVQQRATREVAASRAARQQHPDTGLTARLPVLALVGDLARSPMWLTGWVTNLAGFLVQAAALHLGSVALVQPLLVAQLIFTLPLVSLMMHHWPLLQDWLAGLAVFGGVAIFLSVRGAIPEAGSADRLRIIIACWSAIGLVSILIVVAAGRRPEVHAAEIALAAGVCFALTAVLTKLTAADLIHRGVAATATDWPGYALAASTIVGVLLEHEAFRSGPLPIGMTVMTITNPVASYLIGILAFNVNPPTDAGHLAAVTASGFLLALGTIGLANSPTVRADAKSAVIASQAPEAVR